MSDTAAGSPEPRRRDPEGRRRAILTAAAEIVIEQGPPALTHRAIATRAGVSLGSTTQYFGSIDELREATLQQLADEIDESLNQLEPLLAGFAASPERAVAEIHEFLRDTRAVHTDVALMSTGTTDPRMRALAQRWTDRLIDMLAEHVGRERATAIAVYLDGATIHAALRDAPLDRDHLERIIVALTAMPDPAGPTTPHV
ncbi:TetR family transcriptional regulator [Leucobacter sp. UCD-THU]|uniref:TetR family transcriptional regulator n=1 Tax=Leucobacter muris TaxID=1935379 RepID=A0ABX5QCW9_9MICO|nr:MULTISPECIES: TetR family transcriptional regulator [Leucobacter]EYT56730.1 TetR family transcriptional regulator [Leucobacter sp. UCD-THU]QAB16910.1 TetR family transcriptional regulator [Leucobacter muris]